jgi:hypothetical protein
MLDASTLNTSMLSLLAIFAPTPTAKSSVIPYALRLNYRINIKSVNSHKRNDDASIQIRCHSTVNPDGASKVRMAVPHPS